LTPESLFPDGDESDNDRNAGLSPATKKVKHSLIFIKKTMINV